MKALSSLFIPLALATSSAVAQESSSWEASLWSEAGIVWQTRNDVQIPNDTGTRFSIAELGKGPLPALRIYAGLSYERHELRALAAPLTLELEGNLEKSTRFQGRTFAPDQRVTAKYRFDSYRLTYRYTLVDNGDLTVKVGLTGKIRDAEIRLTQAGQSAARTNTGFVPLLHGFASYRVSDGFAILADADALASPQGRAEDLALLVGFSPVPWVQARMGYRMVEGGSKSGGKVYNFTWLHYAVLGAEVRL